MSIDLPIIVMQTVNIHEAKTHLSRLVEQATRGEPFVIAKAGKPLVKVMALHAPDAGQQQRLGFMADRSPCLRVLPRRGAGQVSVATCYTP